MNEKKDLIAINRLILKSIDGSISREDFLYLDSLIANDPSIADHYAEFMSIYVALREPGEVATTFSRRNQATELDGDLDIDMWKALAASEKTAIAVEVERIAKKPEIFHIEHINKTTQRQRVISKATLITAILSSAALIFLIVLTWLDPVKGPTLATLTDSINAMWEGTGEILSETQLPAGKLKLVRGLAELEMYDGAVVTLQAPTEIELEGTNRISLISGKISAVVPPSAIGFVVRTGGVSIVDYGTEFGVVADSRGNVETHVFKGEVEMRLGNDPLVFDVAKRVTKGHAVQKNSRRQSHSTCRIH